MDVLKIADFEVIESTKEARENFINRHDDDGKSCVQVQVNEIAALLSGKTLAINDGEYTVFVSLEER